MCPSAHHGGDIVERRHADVPADGALACTARSVRRLNLLSYGLTVQLPVSSSQDLLIARLVARLRLDVAALAILLQKP